MKHKIFIYLVVFLSIATASLSCNTPSTPEEEEPEIERSYTKSIERNYSNEIERALIDSAEAFYPPRDSVVAVLNSSYPNRNYDELLPETGYWHYDSFDGIFLPYVITHEAVLYYSNIIDVYKDKSEEQIVNKASFRYKANVSFKEVYQFEKPDEWPELIWMDVLESEQELIPNEVYENVYVVNMYLEWDSYCSQVCGLSITHLRLVLFDENGELIGAFLDGNWHPISVI